MADRPRNSPDSVRQRLLNIAREQGHVFEVVLVTYGLERLLYRLSISEHRDSFVLKGGMLVTLWTGDENRVTRDADFLGFGDASEGHLISVFSQIMSKLADDGLVYDVDRLTAEAIREEQQYGGIRRFSICRPRAFELTHLRLSWQKSSRPSFRWDWSTAA